MDTSSVKSFIGHHIDGQEYVDNGLKIDVYNPSTGEILGIISSATDVTIDKAIGSAQKAFETWKETSLSKKTSILFNYKALLEKNIDKLSILISEDLGKTKNDALGEIRRGIENVEYACGIANSVKGEHNKNISTSIDSWSQFEPLGVVLGITPFNFPAMVPLWMFPLAIAAGNTFILKPSEKDPIATQYLARLFSEAGLPDGVLNVLNGGKETVNQILKDSRIKAVSFVGSTPIAKHIYNSATINGKRCQALGGAKNHALVLPDANIKQTVNQLLGAAFGSSGQRCMALSVAVTVGGIEKKLIEELKLAMNNFNIGNQSNNDFGPVVSREHKENIIELINSAEEEGAQIIVDGRTFKPKETKFKNGFFLGATLINGVTPKMKSYKEEIFGPVLQIVNVNSFNEGLNIINENPFGNGTCIFTSNGEAARYFNNNVDVGMVGVNIPLPVPASYHSFGGWKDSFFGDLNIYGPDGLRFYTQRKTITQKWPSSNIDDIKFSMPTNN